MAENGERPPLIAVQYDDQADILTFTFTAVPQPAVAEEAADEVWVRYDPNTSGDHRGCAEFLGAGACGLWIDSDLHRAHRPRAAAGLTGVAIAR